MRSPVNPDTEMNKMVLPYGNIEIEYCPQSGGVWLDKGELEKLVEVVEERAKQKYATQPNMAPQFKTENNAPTFKTSDYDREDYKYSQYPHKKKKESILGEIFDIF
jgi:uncharacterized protein